MRSIQTQSLTMKANNSTFRGFTTAVSRLVRGAGRVTRLLPLVIAGNLAGLTGSAAAQSALVPRIVDIAPREACVGQIITVHTAVMQVSLPPLTGYRAASYALHFPLYNPQSPRIYFADTSGQPTIRGLAVVRIDDDSYRVTVPPNARSGPLRFENGFNSLVNLSVSVAGYTISNLSQFDVVSVRIDGIERLAPAEIQAVSQSSATFNLADIGTTPGNHLVEVTIGPSLAQRVIVYAVQAQATSPTNVIEVTLMAAGEYLASSPNRTVAGNKVTCSWQTFVVAPDPADSFVKGFDFTFDAAAVTTTWTHWSGSRSNQLASGRVVEPTNWLLNPTAVVLQLRRTNGQAYMNVTVDLLNASLVAADGFPYDLQ